VSWQLITGYEQGGYAKTNFRLNQFIRQWDEEYHIPLEPVYSGKMMFGVVELIRAGFFKTGTTILALHTGGMQGAPYRNEEFNT
jgi:1-aminocyclopropane-1-carboxylate deaminase